VPPTRRAFLAAAAAAGASIYLGREEVSHTPPDAPNVLVVMIDTLRVDHVYGRAARTPYMDALAAEGLTFTRAFPEAMPTVPARNSLLTGRRMFPFTAACSRSPAGSRPTTSARRSPPCCAAPAGGPAT
jgi:hypothetical protein